MIFTRNISKGNISKRISAIHGIGKGGKMNDSDKREEYLQEGLDAPLPEFIPKLDHGWMATPEAVKAQKKMLEVQMSNENKELSCENCRYCFDSIHGGYECRRYPPRGDNGKWTRLSSVLDKCGEYRWRIK